MIRITMIMWSTVLLMLASCSSEPSVGPVNPSADVQLLTQSTTIVYGGDIVTMEGVESDAQGPITVESVVYDEGLIVYTGDQKKAVAAYPQAQQIDLKGKTLMPGFIDPHVHPVSIAAVILAYDIIAPFDWVFPDHSYAGVQTPEAYLQAVESLITSKQDKSELVLIWGYHKYWHDDLTLEKLDSVTGNTPVIIWQRSTHEYFFNSAAVQYLNINKQDYQGIEQIDWQNFHFYEMGYMAVKLKIIDRIRQPDKLKKGLKRLSVIIRNNGLTTIAEPGFPFTPFDQELPLLQQEMNKNPGYQLFLMPGIAEQISLKMTSEQYRQRMQQLSVHNSANISFLTNQFKSFSDGAIYSPVMQLKDGYKDDSKGEWILNPMQGAAIFNDYWDAGIRLHIHANGDLGIEAALDYIDAAQQRNPRVEHRTTLHHLGYFTKEQALRMKQLDVEASVNPYYFWALADKYSEVGLGAERAESLVSMGELTVNNIPLSLHSDFSMAPLEPLKLAWVAVNRITANGNQLTPQQRISVWDAMQAITINAARHIGQEQNLGSIKVGKQANFTLLKDNPFKIDSKAIKDIEIIGTIYQGEMFTNN